MRKYLTTLGAAAMALAPISSFAASTVNPSTPAQNAALASAPIRANFQAAYNDINNLLSMYYGPTAPLSPSNLQSWANSSGFPVIVLNYYNSARATWIPYAQINVTANTYQTLVGSGVAATPPIALTFPGNVATFALNYGADFTLSGNALVLANQNASPGTYGDATHVAQVSVDAKGRTTGATSVIITHAVNDLAAANNLSDLANVATARTNLGLGTLAPASAGTGLAIDGSGNLDLQPGTATAIGGVESLAPAAHQFMTGITAGAPAAVQPQASDVAGLGALATANAGVGIAVSGGAANLQPAQSSAIGGVESVASVAHQWVAYIDSSGIPHQTQPQLTDIGGLTNAVTNADLAQSGAATFKGNPTGAAANATDFTIQGLTANTSPNMTLDLIPIYNHTTGTIQNVSASQLFGSVGNVTGVNGLVGSVTLADNGGAKVVSSGTTVTFGSPGGFLNKFRNGSVSIWQRGTSGLATTTTITNKPAYTADGLIGYSFGAAATCKQAAGVPGVTAFALECDGFASNTDIKIGERIESVDAAALAGGTDTVQFEYKQTTGTTQTPKIVGCYATTTDTWNGGTNKFDCANNSDATSDLASTSLTPCPSGVWCLESYTFTANANASNGYELDADCNAAFTASLACSITALDVRATPGATIGINANPPPPELPYIQAELTHDQRYFAKSYSQSVVPGASVGAGGGAFYLAIGATSPFMGFEARYPVPMRAQPTLTIYDNAGNSGKVSVNTGSWTNNEPFATTSASDAGFAIFLSNVTSATQMSFDYTASAEL